MMLIPAVFPGKHVADGTFRLRRIAFGKQVCVFMLATQETGTGGIRFRESEMPDNPKACGTKRSYKTVSERPAIETYAKAVVGQYAVHLGESRF